MEDQKQDIWCSIKEFKKINSWARGVTLRWIRKRAKEGMLLDPVLQALHPISKCNVYRIKITDPKDIKNLEAYRAVKAFQKANRVSSASQESDPFSKMSDSDDIQTEPPSSPRITIRVPIYTPIDIML